MKKALVRFEDIGPGDTYINEESLIKLKIVADYLESENIPFHAGIIPRFVNPPVQYDKSISETGDPSIESFNHTLRYLQSHGCSLGMHGYTHQYDQDISGNGFEFYYYNCQKNCPPNDPIEACTEKSSFENSYASSRMRTGLDEFEKAGLKIDWFETPHYMASPTQRQIIQSWSGIMYENDPTSETKKLTILDTDSQFYRGAIYVPTMLYYVSGSKPDYDVTRICNEIMDYSGDDLAAFFYHPYLEFRFITIESDGSFYYDDNSYLKRLVRCFKAQDFTFVHLLDLVTFIPSLRQTDFFPTDGNILFAGNISGDKKTGLITWVPESGGWYYTTFNFNSFPNRHNEGNNTTTIRTNWAKGRDWFPLIGDFDGDGKDDVVVWDCYNGDWQVALSSGTKLVPSIGRGDYHWLKPWAIGTTWVPLIGDFNGDGKDDIAVWNPQDGNWQVALSNGTSFKPSIGRGDYIWLKPWARGNFWIPLVGDFNGDGKDDIAVWNPQDGNWQVALSDGTKFVPSIGRGDYHWLKPWAIGDQWKAVVGDFNGDGKDDILTVNTYTGYWQVALSTGEQFIPNDKPLNPWAGGINVSPLVGDFNGEGYDSICARNCTLRNGTVDFAISVLKRGLN